MSDSISRQNVQAIRNQIRAKMNYNQPYYATQDVAGSVLTDFDHFPYRRYFRGIAERSAPLIAEREAGYRPRQDACYRHHRVPKICPVNYCWQAPCTTVFPCKPFPDEQIAEFVLPP